MKVGNNKSYEYGSKQKLPNNEFVKDVVSALDYQSNSKIGKQLIDKISSSTTKTLNVNESKKSVLETAFFSCYCRQGNRESIAFRK